MVLFEFYFPSIYLLEFIISLLCVSLKILPLSYLLLRDYKGLKMLNMIDIRDLRFFFVSGFFAFFTFLACEIYMYSFIFLSFFIFSHFPWISAILYFIKKKKKLIWKYSLQSLSKWTHKQTAATTNSNNKIIRKMCVVTLVPYT